MGSIGFVTSGDGGQLRFCQDFAPVIGEPLYLRRLDEIDLDRFGAVVIPDFSNQELLHRHAGQINAYLAGGGFLIVFGANRIEEWLTTVEVPFFERETEDWKWWMKPGGRLEVYQPEPRHPMAEAVERDAMCWHFFGAFRFVEGASPILNLDGDEGCIMYDQRLAQGGRLIASTLDPHTHHGRGFMPATTRFLNGFYPWLAAETKAHG
jgi:hypothetical protein